MRFYILRALFIKEVRRHVANRGGLVLGALLIVAALLLSVFNPGTGGGGTGGGSLIDGVHRCMIEYDEQTAWIEELQQAIPNDLQPHILFVMRSKSGITNMVNLPPGTGSILVRLKQESERAVLSVEIWHPPENPAGMANYEAWFWRALRDHYQRTAEQRIKNSGSAPNLLSSPDSGKDDLWAIRDSFRQLDEQLRRVSPQSEPLPLVQFARKGLGAKELDLRSAIATGMVVFALYFTCCYLLPTLTCEERERGVLLAQALSPASPAEILTAKFLFYPLSGIALAAMLAGIYKPAVLGSLFFWLALLGMSSGFLGIGMTVATLAKTQRSAFMGSMCYLLSVALVLFICQQNRIPFLPYLALEYHGPRVMHAAITQEVTAMHWFHLLGTASLAACWISAAGWLFRRRGWQ
jgi:hypothetical protein